MSQGTMNRIRADVSGATGRDGSHGRDTLDELKGVLEPELNLMRREGVAAQATAKE
jgi:hypothetical protein